MISGDRNRAGLAKNIALLPLLVVFGLYGCTTIPSPGIPPEPVKKSVDFIHTPAVPEKSPGPAGSLYKKARKSAREGKWEQAEVLIERALRIEPGNGYYWYTLAHIKFERGDYTQTRQLCRKSKSLAAGDENLVQLTDSLMRRIP